ncbi:MAG: glycosyltransferase family 4 protein [bacterium]
MLEKIGGVENVILWTARELKTRGHRVVVFSSRIAPEISEILLKSDIPYTEIPYQGSMKNMGQARRYSKSINNLFSGLDVVNIHNFPASVWFYLSGLTSGIPVLLTYHEPPRHLYEQSLDSHFLNSLLNTERKPLTVWFDSIALAPWRALDKKAVNSYSAIVTDSENIKEKIHQIYGRTARVLNLGTPDYAHIFPQAPLTGKSPGDPKVLFTASRLGRMKNLDTVIHSFALVTAHFQKQGIEVTLKIAGEGDQTTRLKNLCRRLEVSSRVEFLGIIPESEIFSNYSRADAVIYLPFDEPLGLVPIEAGLMSKPVVASNHGGPAEIIIDKKTGFLVDPGDAPGAARAVIDLLENPELAQAAGRAAREHVSQKYSSEKYIKEYEALLAEVARPV